MVGTMTDPQFPSMAQHEPFQELELPGGWVHGWVYKLPDGTFIASAMKMWEETGNKMFSCTTDPYAPKGVATPKEAVKRLKEEIANCEKMAQAMFEPMPKGWSTPQVVTTPDGQFNATSSKFDTKHATMRMMSNTKPERELVLALMSLRDNIDQLEKTL